MRVSSLRLIEFKRFDDLTIDLGAEPKKIIALAGPNGCGKSSIFDAFEQKLKQFRNYGNENDDFYSKATYYADESKRRTTFDANRQIIITTTGGNLSRKSFYIRTSYRFTAKFNVQQFSVMPAMLQTSDEPISSISLDSRVEWNYKRMLGKSFYEFFRGNKTGKEVRDELLNEVNRVLSRLLDIEISDIGNILENRGQLFFRKGNVVDFPYANLSSGEKEVVDIVMDLIMKTKEYTETASCIDEPELHINTSIQRQLLLEIDKLIPATCQLWIATHSLGFLRALQDELRENSQILDSSEKDFFTGAHTICPVKMSRQNWKRIFATALDDLIDLVSPRRIIYCEGKDIPNGMGEDSGLDANVLNNIFSEEHNDTVFVSSGGNTELDQRSDIAIAVLGKVLKKAEILILKDRDISSGKLTTEADRQLYLSNNPVNHRVFRRWEIENYLFDKEVLTRFCNNSSTTFNESGYDTHVLDIVNDNVKDKVAIIKNVCGITTSINPQKFKLNLSQLITKDMKVYSELERCIFSRQ